MHPATEQLKPQRIREWVEQAMPLGVQLRSRGCRPRCGRGGSWRAWGMRSTRCIFLETEGTSRQLASGLALKSCFSTRRFWRLGSGRTGRPGRRRGWGGRERRSGGGSSRCRSSRPGTSCGPSTRSTRTWTRGEPMQRLLMGEVGSGKTVVALLLDAAGAGSRVPGGADGADRDAGRTARRDAGKAAGRRGDSVRAADRGDPGAAAARGAGAAGERRAGAGRRHPRADRARRPLRPPRPLRGRRAAPLRRRASAGRSTRRGSRGWRRTSCT